MHLCVMSTLRVGLLASTRATDQTYAAAAVRPKVVHDIMALATIHDQNFQQ